MNSALASFSQCLSEHHLETTAHKTEAFVVSRRRNVMNTALSFFSNEKKWHQLVPSVPGNTSGPWLDVPAAYWEKCPERCGHQYPSRKPLSQHWETMWHPAPSLGKRYHKCPDVWHVSVGCSSTWSCVSSNPADEWSLRSSALRKSCGFSTVGSVAAHVLGKTIPANLLSWEKGCCCRGIIRHLPYPAVLCSVNKVHRQGRDIKEIPGVELMQWLYTNSSAQN